jgi:type II secretory ATPase GspE/PulE/Tfp pilus assembly ATPase PilB-like protein
MEIKNDSVVEAGAKIARAILLDAVKSGVSDIHLEPEYWGIKIRYRIDGVMHDIMEIPPEFQNSLAEHLKEIAGMDRAITQVPQEGKIWLPRKGDNYLFLASCLPVIYGERIVLHLVMHPLLDESLENLGFSEDTGRRITDLMNAREGLFIITGALADGRSTTALNVLKRLQKSGRCCAAIEDSPSYELEEVLQIGSPATLNTDAITRSIEAVKPDVVLIDEVLNFFMLSFLIQLIRAKRLVIAITRSRDAFTALADIETMGFPRDLCTSSLLGVLAQKLVKKICPDCRELMTPDESRNIGSDDERAFFAGGLYHGKGCEACRNTGYRGRTVVTQFLAREGKVESLLREGITMAEIKARCGNDVPDLLASAREKCAGAITTLEEITRILKRPWRDVKYEKE